jgi:hypothetical protein|nr:MAG TPA: hypothetical protein [Caudoviricetes sp.]
MKPIDAGALKDNLTDIYGNENRLVCLKDVLDLIGEQPDVVRPKEMMSCEVSEYIKRDVAISAIKNVIGNLDHECKSMMDFYSALWDTPTSDVVEVRHGRWEPGNPICPICGEDKFKGLDADIWSDWEPKHCPNCGAKMDKE